MEGEREREGGEEEEENNDYSSLYYAESHLYFHFIMLFSHLFVKELYQH